MQQPCQFLAFRDLLNYTIPLRLSEANTPSSSLGSCSLHTSFQTRLNNYLGRLFGPLSSVTFSSISLPREKQHFRKQQHCSMQFTDKQHTQTVFLSNKMLLPLGGNVAAVYQLAAIHSK